MADNVKAPVVWDPAVWKAVMNAIHDARFTQHGREPQPMDESDRRYCTALTNAALRAIPALLTRADNPPDEGVVGLLREVLEALDVFCGHDSYVNLRARYGENWWAPMRELRNRARAALTAPRPAAPGDGEAWERAMRLLDEVHADLPYLMGRASTEGHGVGQDLARETAHKFGLALHDLRALAPPVQARGGEEVERLRADATRYRYLVARHSHEYPREHNPPCPGECGIRWEHQETRERQGWDIDALLDAEIATLDEEDRAALAPSAARDEQTGGGR
jgi:hypothetical protein